MAMKRPWVGIGLTIKGETILQMFDAFNFAWLRELTRAWTETLKLQFDFRLPMEPALKNLYQYLNFYIAMSEVSR